MIERCQSKNIPEKTFSTEIMANTCKSSFHWCEIFLNFCWNFFLTDSQNSNSYRMLHQVIITVLLKKWTQFFNTYMSLLSSNFFRLLHISLLFLILHATIIHDAVWRSAPTVVFKVYNIQLQSNFFGIFCNKFICCCTIFSI